MAEIPYSPVGKHIGQTKVRVILERVQIEEIRHVHVLVAECIVWSIVGVVACRIIVNLNALHLRGKRIISKFPLKHVYRVCRNYHIKFVDSSTETS